MLHYIRVTAGPYSGQIYQFKTKKDAIALEQALNRLRPGSTDYGNDRDYFPETHLKGRRASTSNPLHAVRAQLKASGRQHATKKRDRAEELIASYGTWTSGYSNEDLDRTVGLANRLTDVDRAEGRPAPPVGYSKERYTQAKQVVADANRYGGRLSIHHEAKRRLQAAGIDFSRDSDELRMSDKQLVAETAREAGYRKRKDAPGSTARMYFQYLSRLK